MVEKMKPLASRISYDGLGSVIAVQEGAGRRAEGHGRRPHGRARGLIRRVTPDGFLTMQLLGGWLDQALVDQRWTILGAKGPVLAVTGIRDAHLATAAERNRVIPRESIFLDVGARIGGSGEADGTRSGRSGGTGGPVRHHERDPELPGQGLGRSGRLRHHDRGDGRLCTRAASERDPLDGHGAGGDRPARGAGRRPS